MYKYLILLILSLSLFLRFYNLPENFIFAGDEEHQAILAQTIVKDFHIIWIGVNAAHLGFYLGPYWTYLTALWLYLSNGDPQITGYVSALIGVLTTWLIIIAGSTLFNKRVGLTAGLLYATSPLMVFFDQKYWNPSPIPLLSVLMLLSLINIKKNHLWAIVFSASFGLVFHTHLSLIPLIFIAVIYFKKQKIKLPGKIIILSILTFLVMVAPLIIFDYFHKGSNITTPLRYKEITSDYRNKINPSHHMVSFFQALGRVWYLKPFGNNSDELITSCSPVSRIGDPNTENISKRTTSSFWLSFFGLTVLGLFLINKQTWHKNYALLALFILSISTAFLLFPGGAYEYYLLGIFPLLYFLPGILIDHYRKFKFIIITLIFLISVLGIFTIFTNNPEFGFKIKKSLIKQTVAVIKDQPFELKQKGICHFYEGWRYLFELNGQTPQKSDSDQSLGWLYSSKIEKKPIKFTIILSEKRVPVDFEIKNSQIINSGGFSAYIFKNY